MDSTFQSYRHESGSMITAFSSVVTLAGYVNFTDGITGISCPRYSSGTAVFLNTSHPDFKSSLNITTGATVYFINLNCSNRGGAVYSEYGVINVHAKATVVFMYNTAFGPGGAIALFNGSMNVGIKSIMEFAHNEVRYFGGGALGICNGDLNISSNARIIFRDNVMHGYTRGGAVFQHNRFLNIDRNAHVSFSHNIVHNGRGGAVHIIFVTWNISSNVSISFKHNKAFNGGTICMEFATKNIDTDSLFYNNTATSDGGAIYFYHSIMHIYCQCTVNFSMNVAHFQGGAIYAQAVSDRIIIVDSYTCLFFHKNSAFQGGALYTRPWRFTIEVRHHSSLQFVNNTAFDVGGAAYSDMQSASPCMFMVTNYLADISFIGNFAENSIGHHMYGTSLRDVKCDSTHMRLENKENYKFPYCLNKGEDTLKHANIFIRPGLNETLSPVSSAPWRVCLCDSHGKPQCANWSQILTNVSIYRGEEFKLSLT